jgi:hypothetical protein
MKTDFSTQRRKAAKPQSDGWKLASYEVAGDAFARFVRAERTMDFRRPFWTDFVLDGEPDTLCLANFRLSIWDERRAKIILRWTFGAIGV